jgi:hypothetical protein
MVSEPERGAEAESEENLDGITGSREQQGMKMMTGQNRMEEDRIFWLGVLIRTTVKFTD